MNAHEKILGCNADANYPDADPVAKTKLAQINLNTYYADTDADLCIRFMSLCCTTNRNKIDN